MSTGLTINFKDGQRFTNDQKHQLGIVVPDAVGDNWSYVQLHEDLDLGLGVYDMYGSDFFTGGIGTLTAAAAVGTALLVDSGAFTAALAPALPGAIGFIHDGAGQGTSFYIEEVIDTNTLRIRVITTQAGGFSKDGKWPVALTTASDYSIDAPGVVKKWAATSKKRRGVIQAEDGGKAGQFGFVKQTGRGILKIDVSGNALGNGGLVTAAGSGLGQGAAATPTVANLLAKVGTWSFIDIAGSTDRYGLVNLDIVNEDLSYRLPDDKVALNRIDVA